MALPPSSALPPQLPPVEAAAPVAPVAGKGPDVTPIDLLIFTSEEDWEDEADNLRDAAGQHAVNAEVLFAEDLEGRSAEDKLASLYETIGEWLRNGKLQPSTVIYVSLHGGMDNEDSDADTSPTSAASQASYGFSADDSNLEFPGERLVSALRHASPSGGSQAPDFAGLIIWAACRARKLAPVLQASGGENIILAGNKPVQSTDAEDCMLDVIDQIGARKRDGQPPLSGRDYWMHLRNVSGEHIAFVQDTSTEIHKVLSSGHSEPTLQSRTGRSAGQPLRILEAKVIHGSPKAVRAVFDTFGKDQFSELSRAAVYASLALDTFSSAEGWREKMAVLEKNGFGFPRTPDELRDYLSQCAEHKNVLMLSELLQSQGELLARLLPTVIEDMAGKKEMHLLQGLGKIFSENESVALQWLSAHAQSQPPAIRTAIDRYLKHTAGHRERPYLTAQLCLAGHDRCLMNLLRHAFELNRDLVEAESLMPVALAIPKPSQVHSYLNVLLQNSMMRTDGVEIQKMLARHGIEKIDDEDFFSNFDKFTNFLPWIQ